MEDTLEGCDWCCGGGDQEMEDIIRRLDEIRMELGTRAAVPVDIWRRTVWFAVFRGESGPIRFRRADGSAWAVFHDRELGNRRWWW